MEHYIHYFETEQEFDAKYNGNDYHEPLVSVTNSNSSINYNKGEYETLLTTPLTFEILSSGTIYWVTKSTTKTIEYKKNNGEWTSITSNIGSSAPSITVVSGDTIQFRGNNTTYATSTSNYNWFKCSTTQFKVKGNIMSLIDSTNFSILTTLSSDYTFFSLFTFCTGLTDTSKLILPATTLTNMCYHSMFYNCTSLTTAPKLLATTLGGGCYNSMFYNCTSLTTAPELPASILANSCYLDMFKKCTSLTTAPELPAITLKNYCYNGMFSDCTSLNYIKCLATDISATDCIKDWVEYISPTGIFVKNPSMTNWPTGLSGIPSGWTVQDAV